MGKLCFMFGHSTAPVDILPEIENAVEHMYTEHGIRSFVVGRYGSFDRLAGQAVKNRKKAHSDISLRLLLPYHPALRPFTAPEGYDGTLYPEGMETVPPRFAIAKANQLMVKDADAVICYVKHPGNTEKLLQMALAQKRKRGLVVWNIVESICDCVKIANSMEPAVNQGTVLRSASRSENRPRD